MPATTTDRLKQIDREIEELKDGFVETIARLQDLNADDASFPDRWSRIAGRLGQLRRDLRPQDLDKDQALTLYGAMLDICALRDDLDGPRRLDALNAMLISFERMRHVIRDALDEHVDGVDGNTATVTAELLTRLPDASRSDVADLLGIDRRTLARWRTSDGTPSRRLQVVARLVAILRHNWSGEGRLAWFHRARFDLGGQSPLDLLGADIIDEDVLIASARAGRSQYAS